MYVIVAFAALGTVVMTWLILETDIHHDSSYLRPATYRRDQRLALRIAEGQLPDLGAGTVE